MLLYVFEKHSKMLVEISDFMGLMYCAYAVFS